MGIFCTHDVAIAVFLLFSLVRPGVARTHGSAHLAVTYYLIFMWQPKNNQLATSAVGCVRLLIASCPSDVSCRSSVCRS